VEVVAAEIEVDEDNDAVLWRKTMDLQRYAYHTDVVAATSKSRRRKKSK
jgi:hypothetical protein